MMPISKTDKIERSEAGYRQATPEELQSNVMCGTCDYYNNDETCDLVKGIFHSEDYCKLFKPGGMNKFLKFQKEVATTGSTGASTDGASYFTATYGDGGPKSKRVRNATHTVTKGFDVPNEEIMFTSRTTAAEAFGNPRSRVKDKTGAGRVGELFDDHSPDMGNLKLYEKAYGEQHSGLVKVEPDENARNERRQSRRKLNTETHSTSGHTVSTNQMPMSHATTLIGKNQADVIINSNFTTELVKWVINQSRIEKAGGDQYEMRILPNEQWTQLMRGGDQTQIKEKGKKGSPTTEKTVPEYKNMGQAGGLEASGPVHDATQNLSDTRPGMTQVNLPERARNVKDRTNQGGAFVGQPNQGGMNVMGMEKGAAGTGGGTPHVFAVVQPSQDGSESNRKKYIEGESEIEEDNTQDDVEERVREKEKSKTHIEAGMDGPIIDDAGAAIASLGNQISVQTMEKQGFDYEIDALHRGGSLDEDGNTALPADDEEIERSLRKKELSSLTKFVEVLMKGGKTIGKID